MSNQDFNERKLSAKPRRIVFFRSGAIGDVIQCLPLIKLVKKQNPEASVELITATVALQELLSKRASFIDRIYLVRKTPGDSLDFISSIQRQAIDEFVFLHSNWFRAWVWNFQFIKAKKLIQYKKDTRFSAQENFALTYFPQLTSKFFEEKSRLGFAYESLDYQTLVRSLNIFEDEALAKEKFLQGNTKQSYICIVLGVGKLRPHRAYPLALWAQFINKVLNQSDLKIKILGGTDEKQELIDLILLSAGEFNLATNELSTDSMTQINFDQLSNKISEFSQGRIESHLGKTSLFEAATIMENSLQVYSADTGLLHLAAAVDSSIVSMFSITSANRTGPWHPKAQIMQAPNCQCLIDNSNSQKHCSKPIGNHASCMWNLKPDVIANHDEAIQI